MTENKRIVMQSRLFTLGFMFVDCLLFASMAFWVAASLLAWMDKVHAAVLATYLELALLTLAPVVAVLTVVACHRGWFQGQPAD